MNRLFNLFLTIGIVIYNAVSTFQSPVVFGQPPSFGAKKFAKYLHFSNINRNFAENI